MTWPERADRWLEDHPIIKLILDGLAIVVIGLLFTAIILGLMP